MTDDHTDTPVIKTPGKVTVVERRLQYTSRKHYQANRERARLIYFLLNRFESLILTYLIFVAIVVGVDDGRSSCP